MLILIIGVALWAGAHLLKRLAPSLYVKLGSGSKGIVALMIVASIVLMVVGYRMAPFIPVWTPPSWTVHLNNTLVLFAVYLMSPGPKKGALFYKMRHPMLAGFKLWAFAHLLVNGDLASIVLFGGLLAWAVANLIAINKQQPDGTPNPKGTLAKDAMFALASVLLFGVIAYAHIWLGVWPFPS